MSTPATPSNFLEKAVDGTVFCPLPWLELCASVDGVWGRCCLDKTMYHSEYYHTAQPTFKLDEDAIGCLANSYYAEANPDQVYDAEQAFNSPNMKSTRLAMIAGRPLGACHSCYVREAGGADSYRLQSLREYGERLDLQEIVTQTQSDGSLKRFPIELDLRLGNVCNLECIMCSFPVSSKWHSRSSANWSHARIDPYSDNSAFWNSIAMHVNDIDRIRLAGGEPLLAPSHNRLLDIFITKDVARNVKLTYQTNLTVLPNSALTRWKEFQSVDLGASCDGTEEVFERIRRGAKWSEFCSNLTRARHAGFRVSIHTSPQRDNVHHLRPLVRWTAQERLDLNLSNFVVWPPDLCVRNLPFGERETAAMELGDLADECEGHGNLKVARQLRELIAFMTSPER